MSCLPPCRNACRVNGYMKMCEAENSIPPRVIMKQEIGWIERFSVTGLHIPITMQISYGMDEMIDLLLHPVIFLMDIKS